MNLASILLLLGLIVLTILAIKANLDPKHKPSCHGGCEKCGRACHK